MSEDFVYVCQKDPACRGGAHSLNCADVNQYSEVCHLRAQLAQAEQERDDYKDAAQADRDAIGEYVLREQALLAEGRLLREALYYYRAGGDGADRAAMALDSSPLIAAEAERVRKLEKVADEMRLLEHSCWAQDEDDPPTYGDCLRRGCVRAIPIRPYACSVVAALAALDAKEAPDEQAL